MKVVTNNKFRKLMSYYELSEAQQKKVASDYDYTDYTELSYFVYRGDVYSLDEFIRTNSMWSAGMGELFPGWDGYYSQGFCGGLVVRLSECGEEVIIGRY